MRSFGARACSIRIPVTLFQYLPARTTIRSDRLYGTRLKPLHRIRELLTMPALLFARLIAGIVVVVESSTRCIFHHSPLLTFPHQIIRQILSPDFVG